MLFIGAGCNMDHRSKDDGGGGGSTNDTGYTRLSTIQYLTSSDIDIRAHLLTDRNNDNVLTMTGETQEYMYYRFTKRGGTEGEDSDADSYGKNAAVLANSAAQFTLRDSLVVTDGSHAHGVFSLGEGTNINVSECVVITMSNDSSGFMTSDGGEISAVHATVETYGNNSPAINVYNSGGAIMAERGHYHTSGTNSPVILTRGNVGISSAKIEAGSSQAVMAEGETIVVLQSCDITASCDNLSGSQAVMIYRTGTGNPLSDTSRFTMSGGKLDCMKGDVFYATNVNAAISLRDAEITNHDPEGAFLRAGASSWGTSGINGGKITLYASDQDIGGNIELDDISDMNIYLSETSFFTGAVNTAGTSARIFVSLSDSLWTLTEDSHITSLNCEAGSVSLNGHTLYVNGTPYTAGTDSSGRAINFVLDRNSGTSTDPDDSDDESDSAGHIITNPDTSNNTSRDTNSDTRLPVISSDTSTGSSTLVFSPTIYTAGTVNGVSYRAYNNIAYVSSPVNQDYQKLSIYIPEPYFSSRPLNGYTASTAPIFIPNNSGGYMAADIMTPSSTNPVGLALSRGLVVVSPALRGRNVTDGTAPAAIVDYKAAVKYIRANKSRLPAGNTDRIIAGGMSSGGALAALLGASGNSDAYGEWLEALGAADADDNIYAAVCYCPVTDLENADGAYEWIFGGAKYGEDSVTLIEDYEAYISSLGLKKGNTALEIGGDSDTFTGYIEGLYVQAAQEAILSGTDVGASWLTVSGNTVISADLTKYAESFPARQKSVPAFDKFDLSSPENSEFGYKHFTEYSSEHSTAGGAMADAEIIAAMNPLEHIGQSGTCKFWRIRHGVNDRDITVNVPAVLALKLENAGCTVDFAAVWGQGHGGYYDTDPLFDWIDSICK